MKKNVLIILFLAINIVAAWAQKDSIFNKTIYNTENCIYLKINLYDKNITVPNQEFMGEMAGYLGDSKDFRRWLILDADINGNTATMQMTNDECSEDLTATLTYNENGSYTLCQGEGSTLKIARNRKWKKLPKTLEFIQEKKY